MSNHSIFHRMSDEFKKDREKLKGKSFGQKIQYFIMYYKIPVLLILAVAAIAISVGYSISHSKTMAFHAYFINADNTRSDETLSQDFAKILAINQSKEQVSVDSSLLIDGNSQVSISSIEKFASEINSNFVDACIMPEELFLTYAKEGAYGDIRTYLSDTDYKKYQKADQIIYQENIPVGIRASDFKRVKAADLYEKSDVPVIGIIYNTDHPKEAQKFLHFLAS